MEVFEREVEVHAPLERVWAFHSAIDGLVAVTPDWLRLRVESVVHPEHVENDRSLAVGSEVELSVRPFGRGPRQHWRSTIEVARLETGSAVLRDRMVVGPFDHWEHTHAMYATENGTRLRDRVEYELRSVPGGAVADALAVVGLAPTFRYRHRRTRALLEGGWQGWD